MRIYFITYNMYEPKGGSFKYAQNPVKHEQTVYYLRDERELFIKEWERLLSDDMVYDEVKTFYVDFQKPEIVNISDKLEKLKQSI